MGQYFHPTNIDTMEHLYSHNYNNGLKLMEHSWLGNNFVDQVCALLTPEGGWYKGRIIWIGDYSEYQEKYYNNTTEINPKNTLSPEYGYLHNHDDKTFVDFNKCPDSEEDWKVHPLPILTTTDISRIENEYSGKWLGCSISLEKSPLEGYTEILPDFKYD